MVLEAIMSVKDAVKNPWHMLIFGAVISLIAIGVSYLVFPEEAGLFSVFLITLISAPFMMRLLNYEEDKEEKQVEKIGILERINPVAAISRQADIFWVYTAFFGGMIIALSIAFIILPEKFVDTVFSNQISTIGKISLVLGKITSADAFGVIIMNNLIVMSISFIFALLFGIGAVFILAWNASVVAAAMGMIAKRFGDSMTHDVVFGIPEAIRQLGIHGAFEICGYFIAAIAGGIISVLLSKRNSKDFHMVVQDMVVLMVFSVILITIGAYIESMGVIPTE